MANIRSMCRCVFSECFNDEKYFNNNENILIRVVVAQKNKMPLLSSNCDWGKHY